MQFRFTTVETSLNRAEFRWKWLRFLQHTFALGIVLCLLTLSFALAIIGGWITSKSTAITIVTLLAILAALAWIVIAIAVVAGSPERNWLAAAVERVDRRLLDRLNTLLFLENRPRKPQTDAISIRIAKQVQSVFAAKPSPPPFRSTRPLAYFAAFVIAAAATFSVFHIYAPWSRLITTRTLAKAQPPPDSHSLELAPPSTNNLEQNQNWGEVRITDPGADLKVTKVDVVPLQIEAAANQALKQVGWYSTINGADETNHDLPPPTEPRYALYQPTIYLDELRLSDWDVMTYYAKANTEKENSFASEVYFLEVRPFREDILKMPGGEGGKAYQCLAEMSALINRQQHIIRQTHQHIQKPPEQENLRSQDRMKLSDAEGDLRDSVDHLYAKMAAGMENKPIGEALDNLAKSGKSLNQASTLLKNNSMNEAPNRERSALSELIAARKIFQKAVSDNPNAFDEPKDEEESPIADASKRLNQMAEFRNEAKAAQQFIQKAVEQQRSLERRAKAQSPNNLSKLASEERQLEKSLEDFRQQHPQAFNGTDSESKAAQQAMSKAADSLQNKSVGAGKATQEASEGLEKLDQAMAGHSATQQLADAYKLKEMLDQEIKAFDQYAQGTNNIPDTDLQKTAGAARETINQLKRVAEQEPTRDAFGDPLRDALSGTNKVDLDTKLTQLQMASGDTSAKREQAGQARDGLGKVSKAFGASQPGAMQMAQKSDALKSGSQDNFGMGMAELDSLIKQLEKSNQIPRADQKKQGQEALYNLQLGMREQYGDNDRGNQILLSMNQMLQTNVLDAESLKKLMDQLQHFSVETSDHLAKKEDKPDVTNIDPTRLPPAYRGRIQKYFQKLSEK
jgi:hypothetical protein